MGWAVSWDDQRHRDVGYGVPATCDHPGCTTEIDRGLRTRPWCRPMHELAEPIITITRVGGARRLSALAWKWDVWWSDEPTRSPDGMGHGIGGWARTRLGARRACVEVMERGVDREPGIRLLDEDDWNRNPVELRVEPGVLYVPDGMRFEDEEGDGLPAHDPEIWPAAFEHLTRAHPERWSDDDGSDS